MAHEISIVDGYSEMAYVGAEPWHGLGYKLDQDSPIEVWAETAHLNWVAQERELFSFNEQGALEHMEGKKCLVRSDTGLPLGFVSESYNTVQPKDVLEFYRSLMDEQGYKIETAGNLRGGKRIWALARTGDSFTLKGNDTVNGYILLATSFDGSLATVATRTTVRVVCQNTLSLSVGSSGQRADIRIPHMTAFNPDIVKGQMGLENNESWKVFQEQATELSKRKVSHKEAVEFFVNLLYGNQEQREVDGVDIDSAGVIKKVEGFVGLFHNGTGQKTDSANDTAWGLLNSVTRWADHERGTRTVDSRLEKAWFGDGAKLKAQALDLSLALCA